ncbi:RND family efflux transporter, MFP subunit [Ferrimonas sediminum]|uniref:RND family efflux transporter, MFP subunit n=1 Tax=Ferrimonas sediminum TaxID=718193 RepID=A0A1G8LVE8_9GAMM|nr:efflux RND transporter periplasmic adaptor subunit [Ferrimonas sediminum]SDI59140.1 RND family efflux transporter, MFP subunit [Ferrimonas sediminum]
MTRFQWLTATLLALPLSGCQQQIPQTPEKAPTEVYAQSIQMQNSYPVTHRFVGRVYHPLTSEIGFEPAGTVDQIAVDLGQKVTQGQPLATLDTRLLHSEADQLRASLAQNQADLSLTQATLKRQLSLSKQGYQSEQQLDELRSQKAQLQARRQQLQANLQSVGIRLQKSTLTAPYAGTIVQRHLTQGQVTGNGQPAFTLVPDGAAEARVGLPVRLLSRLPLDHPWRASIDGRPLTLDYIGRSAEVDPATRTVTLRFALGPEQRLLNGQLMYLEVEEQITATNARVPLTALTAGLRGLWNLYVLEDLGDDNYQVGRRDIRVLHADQHHAWVAGAIDNDDRLISTGLQRLVSGQRVTVIGDQSQMVVSQAAATEAAL